MSKNLQIPSIKHETCYMAVNIIVNSDKKSNFKNKIICLSGDNANTNFDGALFWIKNDVLRKLRTQDTEMCLDLVDVHT